MPDTTAGQSARSMNPRLIEKYAPSPDAVERHSIEIHAEADEVYEAIWCADLGSSRVVGALMFMRSLPRLVKERQKAPKTTDTLTLRSMIGSPFGLVSEDAGREVLIGVEGTFWRLADNFAPFKAEHYTEPVPAGLARTVWSFEVQPGGDCVELLTETRVTCGDASSRRKFRAYWFLVRPGSGLIRRVMLRAIRDEAENRPGRR